MGARGVAGKGRRAVGTRPGWLRGAGRAGAAAASPGIGPGGGGGARGGRCRYQPAPGKDRSST